MCLNDEIQKSYMTIFFIIKIRYYMKWYLLLVLMVMVFGADKEEWRKRSIYQLLTDRFARSDGKTDACNNLGIFCHKKVIIVEEVIKELSNIQITYMEWVLMLYGFHLLSIIEMEDIMVIGLEISINSMNILVLKEISQLQ